MSGGLGDDLYVIGAGDTVLENAGQGTDTIQSALSVTLAANVENLLLTGNTAVNGAGNALNNVLNGSQNTAANVLSGGLGDDTYILGVGDTVVENAGEGTDTVQSSITYTLGDNLENLTFTNGVFSQVTGIGNALDNHLTVGAGGGYLSGGDGNDTLDARASLNWSVLHGGAGNDVLLSRGGYLDGEDGDDTLIGGDGYAELHGGAGNDVLMGGSQFNDLYGGDGNDTLTAGAGGGKLRGEAGNDVLDGGTGTNWVYLYGGLDNDTLILRLSGYLNGGAGDDVLIAGGGYAILDGGDGADTLTGGAQYTDMTGGAGNDTLTAGAGGGILRGGLDDDHLLGNAGADVLNGGQGADWLAGAGGNDSLNGGTGNDTYVFNRNDGQDAITDNDPTAGNRDVVGLGVSALDVVFTHSGSNLVMSLHGGSDTLTVQNFYGGSQYQTEVLQTADGQQLLNTQVDQLIQAMASFSASHGGISWDQAITQNPNEVQAVLTAHWQAA